jgi:hypothetical protein
MRSRIEPLVLVIIAIALFVAALYSYRGHPVTDSNLGNSSMPGWAHLVLFVLIGVLVRLGYIGRRRQKHDKGAETSGSRKI